MVPEGDFFLVCNIVNKTVTWTNIPFKREDLISFV